MLGRDYVLETGRIILGGACADLREHARVREAYLQVKHRLLGAADIEIDRHPIALFRAINERLVVVALALPPRRKSALTRVAHR